MLAKAHVCLPSTLLSVLIHVFLSFKLQVGGLYKCYKMTATGKEHSQAAGEAVQTCHCHDSFVRTNTFVNKKGTIRK